MLHQIVIRECKGMEMSCIEMDSRYQRDQFGFIVFRRAGILYVISGVSEIMMAPVQYFVQVQGEAVGEGVKSGWRLCYLARPRARARIAHPRTAPPISAQVERGRETCVWPRKKTRNKST